MTAGIGKTTAPRWPGYGSWLRSLRARSGLTRAQLAQVCSRSPGEIARWERGTALPSLDVLPQLCRALEVSAADLIPKPGDDEPQ